MERHLFTMALSSKWRGMAIATLVIGVWLPLAMGIYQDIDTSVYTGLPEALRELMGIPEGADAATLAYNVMLDFTAALLVAGIAVSIGAASIAGEERDGTLELLLAAPVERRTVLASKLAAMAVVVALATVAIWAISRLAPIALGIEIGETRLGAMSFHLGVNALFYGALAAAVGAATGNRTLASALPAGVMILSYVAVGLLPLVEPLAGLARLFPWYYFSGSQPLVHGVDWTHIGVLVIATLIATAIGFVGFERRDVRSKSVAVPLIERLRANRYTHRWFDRLAGSTRVSSIWVKATSEQQGLLFVSMGAMFVVMGVLMGPMYTAIEQDIASFSDDLPEAVMALAGDGDLSTPEGWFTVESFSFMAPIAVMAVTVAIGARGLAGEEATRTMSLLLANPISRRRVVLEKALAMVVHAAAVGSATFAGVAAANAISGLDMRVAGIAAASFLVTLLGLVFGAFALALGAATGRSRIAVFGTIGVAVSSHLLDSFLPLNDRLEPWARLTPHRYYLGGDPLVDGLRLSHATILVAMFAGLVTVAVVAFDRRDLRSG